MSTNSDQLRGEYSQVSPIVEDDFPRHHEQAAPLEQPKEASVTVPLMQEEDSQHTTTSDQVSHTAKGLMSPETKELHEQNTSSWLPATLRMNHLVPLFLVSVLLAVLTLILTGYSATNNGLIIDDNSPGLFFAWRYVPTILAVFYGIAVLTMAEDLRRTERFARLSEPGGASATESINSSLRHWWNDPSDALNREKNNGKISWALLLTSVVNLLALFAVAPLSGGLLSSGLVRMVNDVPFSTIEISSPLEPFLPVDSQDEVILRTVAGAMNNISTSAWIMNDVAVLPFWPSGSDLPLGAKFPGLPRQWKGQTKAYKSELTCVEMTSFNITNSTVFTISPTETVREGAYIIRLNFPNDCNVELMISNHTTNTWMGAGGGVWSNGPNFSNVVVSQNYEKMQGSATATATCSNGSLILASLPYDSSIPWKLSSKMCTSSYLQADVSAAVMITDSQTTVVIDPAEFKRNQKELDAAQYGTAEIGLLFLGDIWGTKFGRGVFSARISDSVFQGPLAAIATLPQYSSSPRRIIGSKTLVNEGGILQQRYFGEMILGALTAAKFRNIETSGGEVATLERKITATLGVGIALGVALILSGCCILGVAFFSRLHRRPLNLSNDPAAIATVASLLAHTNTVRALFKGTDSMSAKSLTAKMQHLKFSLNQNGLSASGSETTVSVETKTQSEKRIDSRPTIMRSWVAPALLLFLASIAAGILALYKVSQNGGLHQSALVYEVEIGSHTAYAPYSIVPILFAISVKLWFGGIESTLKTVQPFASMLKTPKSISRSLLAEYANSPFVFTSIKALKNRHWVLVIVGFVALATEILTVGISALFQREQTTRSQVIPLPRQLELRTVPEIFLSQSPNSVSSGITTTESNIIAKLYSNLGTGWIYTATAEIVHSAVSPPWSSDAWSFVPIDISGVTAATDLSITGQALSSLNSNITVQTQAIRARLECTPQGEDPESPWWEEIDFKNSKLDSSTNESLWNATNSPPGLDVGYQLSQDVGPNTFAILVCCSNETAQGPGEAAIGYWSANQTSTTQYESYIPSMSARWLVGRPLTQTYNDSGLQSKPTWVFVAKPRISAVKCVPIIEKANASLVVNTQTGYVQNYTILDEVQPSKEAWADRFVRHDMSEIHKDDPLYAVGVQGRLSNYTVSYGVIFWEALLSASAKNLLGIGCSANGCPYKPQSLDERAFNIRSPGLNADLMSYSMLALVNNSKEALFDFPTYAKHANTVVGTFFKHFASLNVTSERGGNAFQPIGHTFPWDFGPVSSNATVQAEFDNARKFASTTSKSGDATLHLLVEALVMSPTAIWLCIALLAFLALSTIVLYSFDRSRFKSLPRDVDTLGSVLAYVYGSERLLEWARENVDLTPRDQGWKGWIPRGHRQDHELKAKMGPFLGRDDEQRWGIEITD